MKLKIPEVHFLKCNSECLNYDVHYQDPSINLPFVLLNLLKRFCSMPSFWAHKKHVVWNVGKSKTIKWNVNIKKSNQQTNNQISKQAHQIREKMAKAPISLDLKIVDHNRI